MSVTSIIGVPLMYFCNVIVENFRGESYVPLFLMHRGSYGTRPALPYVHMITDYMELDAETRRCSENAINEMFFWDEVVALYDLFSGGHDSVLHYRKVPLPIEPYNPDDDDRWGLPVSFDIGRGELKVREGLLDFGVAYEWDLTCHDVSPRLPKFREMFVAGRHEYTKGNRPNPDYWEQERFKLW